MNGSGQVPTNLYLQKQAAGQICHMNHSFPMPALSGGNNYISQFYEYSHHVNLETVSSPIAETTTSHYSTLAVTEGLTLFI